MNATHRLISLVLSICGLAGSTLLGQTAPPEAPPSPFYQNIHNAYMEADWPTFDQLRTELGRHRKQISASEFANINAMARTKFRFQPKWWESTQSASNVSFPAQIWQRKFTANYMPSGALGFQAVQLDPTGRELMVVVTWQPSWVDSPRPSGGPLAQKHGFTLGHIAEVIVWHELGHNYISKFLPTAQVLALYENHHLLFGHLQEFYADLTSLHHSSPPARKVAMMFRLSELSHYDPAEPHTRAAHAIGSIFLAKVLEHPERWPSVHLPPKVPRRNVELNLIRYALETLDTGWTFAEDEAWRGYVNSWIRSYGRRPLSRSTKGMIHLPNKLKMNIMAADDRAHQAERDRWLAERLRAAISSGRADAKFARLGNRIEIPGVFDPPFRGSYSDYDIQPGDIQGAGGDEPDAGVRVLDPDALRRLLQGAAPNRRRPGPRKQPNRAQFTGG